MTEPASSDRVIAGRFRLDRIIGEGGMGEVWAATHLITRKQVALKLLKADDRPELVVRFFREARAASAVRHPNVVQIHDVISDAGRPVMVMDLLEGESLAERMKRRGSMSVAETASIFVPAMSAVDAVHQSGIVHRDLKPDNVFLAIERGKLVPKVLDFGIAKLSVIENETDDTANLTRTGSLMGTPYYMAPEQAFGEKDLDSRVDVWALGVMVYECLAGRRPFDGDNFGQVFKAVTTTEPTPLEDVCPEVPPSMADAVQRMLRRSREQRPPLAEVVAIFREFASEDVITASLASIPPHPVSRSMAEEAQTVLESAMTSMAPDATTPPSRTQMQTAETMALPPGTTVEGQTVVDDAQAPAKSHRGVAIAAGVLMVGALVVGLTVKRSPTAATAEAPSTAEPPAPASTMVESPAPPEASAAPAPLASAAPSSTPALHSAAGAHKTLAKKPPAATSATAPAPAKPPTKLPGGILDSKEAPF